MYNSKLRRDIYLDLTRTQQKKLNKLGYDHFNLDLCPVDVFKQVSKSKKLFSKMQELWTRSMKLVA